LFAVGIRILEEKLFRKEKLAGKGTWRGKENRGQGREAGGRNGGEG
jgi:hypothetical protein